MASETFFLLLIRLSSDLKRFLFCFYDLCSARKIFEFLNFNFSICEHMCGRIDVP